MKKWVLTILITGLAGAATGYILSLFGFDKTWREIALSSTLLLVFKSAITGAIAGVSTRKLYHGFKEKGQRDHLDYSAGGSIKGLLLGLIVGVVTCFIANAALPAPFYLYVLPIFCGFIGGTTGYFGKKSLFFNFIVSALMVFDLYVWKLIQLPHSGLIVNNFDILTFFYELGDSFSGFLKDKAYLSFYLSMFLVFFAPSTVIFGLCSDKTLKCKGNFAATFILLLIFFFAQSFFIYVYLSTLVDLTGIVNWVFSLILSPIFSLISIFLFKH